MHFSQGDMNKLGDLQKTYNWIISFDGPSASPIASEEVHLRCVSTSIPEKTHEALDVVLHGHNFKRPGKVSFNGEISLTFIEDITAEIMNNFRALENDLGESTADDYTGNQKKWEEIKFTTTMVLLDDNNKPTQTYVLHDCMLGTLSAGGELNADNGFFQPTVSLSYNYFTWKKGA